jgi:hypothetical protein
MPFAPPQVAAEVTLLAQAAERFCLAQHRESGPELTVDMAEVRRCLDLVELKFSQMAATFADTDEYDSNGSVSPIHWIRHNCHMGGGAATDRVAVGRQLGAIAESTEAMASGEIGFAHLALIARTASAIAESGTNKPFDETALLSKARQFSVGRFRDFCFHMRHADDPMGYIEDEARAVEARSLSISTGGAGMVWLRGVLDAEGGATIRTALEALARKTGKGDDRTHDRRLADALVEQAHFSLDHAQLPQRGGRRPHLQVTASLETLEQRLGAPAADLDLSIPISSAAVKRLACDCRITRILLDSDSLVIDVGRSKRSVPTATRLALDVRDKGCRWPGCDRPASWSEAHHLIHWIDDGPTDLANLVLLCHRHHWMVHEGQWQVVKTDEGHILTIPPQLDLFHRPRGPDVRVA